MVITKSKGGKIMNATKEKQKPRVWFITGISRGFGRELASGTLKNAISSSARPATGNPTLAYRQIDCTSSPWT
jgi:hypothetical protein